MYNCRMPNVISLGKTTVGVILDRELREELERSARESERSVGAEIRVAIREHLERSEPKEKQT